jgi:hypothetical protein
LTWINLDGYPEPCNDLKFVITGTGRCGTHYYQRLLSLLGIKVGHEYALSRSKTYTGGMDGDVSFMAAPHCKSLSEHGVKILHVVRNPLGVIRSMMGNDTHCFENPTDGTPLYKAHYAKITEEERENLLNATMLYWVRWNELIEPYADFTWRLEDDSIMLIHEILYEIGESRINIEVEKAMREALERRHPNKHDDKLQLHDLKGQPAWFQLKDTAQRFGYTPLT